MKKKVDQLLSGEQVSVGGLSRSKAESLAEKIVGLGADCAVKKEAEAA